MKHLLITTIAAVLLVGCGEEQPVKDAKLARTASQGKIKEVKKYLAAGANVDARRALPEAADRGHKEFVELLIATSADVNAKDGTGQTALDAAEEAAADILRKHGGMTGEELEDEGNRTDQIAVVGKPKSPIAKAPDISIHEAADAGNIEAVKQAIADGADVDVKGYRERTPLHYAAHGGHTEIAEGAEVDPNIQTGPKGVLRSGINTRTDKEINT